MSKALINQYYSNLDRAIQFSKSKNETTVRNHFWILLNEYARKQNYEVVTEVSCLGTLGKLVKPDGIVRNSFGLDIGLWESKDTKTKLEDEIDAKKDTGYPFTNILFEDTETAVLFQRGAEVQRVPMRDADRLHSIITEFISFKSEAVHNFEKALENFKADIPVMVETLRKRIDEAGKKNKNFITVSESFLELCKAEINPEITEADIREMLIQHILTADIFNKIFDDPEFHKHNNIAKELEKLIDTLFTHSERKNLLGEIEHYYDTISAAASGLTDHHEKQKFLKVLYENFYKVYNPKAADRLGVVYTPNEIVKFMIDSTNYLLEKHFNKNLSDKNVEILDPATGTGTFITSIIDSIPKHLLDYKYKHEIHANEVAILPYYVANLNMEFTFKQKMGYYEEFKNLCFVDTLDNTDALAYGGKQHDLFGLSSENSDRIKRQNSKKISVVIGNPPYNAVQESENENNKNRKYPLIDNRIKETFAKYSNTQNINRLYDPYVRFYRWAMDRLDNNGIVCYITNNSYVNQRTFDGFRKSIQEEFDYAYIIDLGGNIRELSGKDGIWLNEENTIFGKAAAVGISIMFLVKKKTNEKLPCQINYIHPCDIRATRIEKLEYLHSHKFDQIAFEKIIPNKNNWINITDNDFEEHILLYSDKTKLTKQKSTENAIFKLYSLGLNTNRDEWAFDFSDKILKEKINYLISVYESERKRNLKKTISDNDFDKKIKWDRELKKYIKRNLEITFTEKSIIKSLYRPYSKMYLYFDRRLNAMPYQWYNIYNENNKYISVPNLGSPRSFCCLSSNELINLNFHSGGAQCLPLYRYNENGERIDNITDWGLEQFTTHYKSEIKNPKSAITKEDIFNYTYAVLHNPAYRKKYELNLKREFPRLPFYKDFFKWAKWGKQLMDLHINYEKAKPFKLIRKDYTIKAEAKRQKEIFKTAEEPPEMFAHQSKIKVKLKADKETGLIDIDELTYLTGVPAIAWEYKLGNRSALEWILDQYKEKKPTDPTIAEKFSTYRFADYKEQVIDLLQRVTTVSVETMEIIKEMEKEKE